MRYPVFRNSNKGGERKSKVEGRGQRRWRGQGAEGGGGVRERKNKSRRPWRIRQPFDAAAEGKRGACGPSGAACGPFGDSSPRCQRSSNQRKKEQPPKTWWPCSGRKEIPSRGSEPQKASPKG